MSLLVILKTHFILINKFEWNERETQYTQRNCCFDVALFSLQLCRNRCVCVYFVWQMCFLSLEKYRNSVPSIHTVLSNNWLLCDHEMMNFTSICTQFINSLWIPLIVDEMRLRHLGTGQPSNLIPHQKGNQHKDGKWQEFHVQFSYFQKRWNDTETTACRFLVFVVPITTKLLRISKHYFNYFVKLYWKCLGNT